MKAVETKMPNDSAAEKASSTENRYNTVACDCHGSNDPDLIDRACHLGNRTSDRSCCARSRREAEQRRLGRVHHQNRPEVSPLDEWNKNGTIASF
jgi:hypothetical protein